jgi:hypothetical protein
MDDKKALQNIYNRVRDHLLAQGERSMRTVRGYGTLCAYRGDDGRKCAVGALISNEAYSIDLETRGACDGGVVMALRASGVDTDAAATMSLLRELQRIHDGESVDAWPKALRDAARHFGLEP